MKKFFSSFRHIDPRVLSSHMIITLAYPAAKAVTSEMNKLQVFTDALTIIALILLIGGVIYSLVLHGDFDIAGFVMKRGIGGNDMNNYDKYRRKLKENRAEAFNYPLFLAVVYLIVCAVIAYTVL